MGCLVSLYRQLLAASVLGHLENKKKLDVNLFAYLLGLNWVAVDLIRHSLSLRNSSEAISDDKPWTQETASVGAGLTVVLWGCLHAQTQGFVAMLWKDRRRGMTLCLGLLLPAVSLINFGLCIPGSWKVMLYWGDALGSEVGMDTYRHRQDIISQTPVLYWKGIPTHSLGLTEVLPITGVVPLVISSGVLAAFTFEVVAAIFTPVVERFRRLIY